MCRKHRCTLCGLGEQDFAQLPLCPLGRRVGDAVPVTPGSLGLGINRTKLGMFESAHGSKISEIKQLHLLGPAALGLSIMRQELVDECARLPVYLREYGVDFADAIAALEDPNRLEEIGARTERHISRSIGLIGTPPTTSPGATSRLASAAALTKAPGPIVHPASTTAAAPTKLPLTGLGVATRTRRSISFLTPSVSAANQPTFRSYCSLVCSRGRVGNPFRRMIDRGWLPRTLASMRLSPR